MRAVMMAGGEGARLRPLTCNRPKPLVPICNRPVMEYALELLRRHSIRSCFVTLHYLADEVMAYFGNGSDWEMRLQYSVEDEPLGTAGSVKRIEEYLTESFIVMSGDALTDFDLTAAIEFHRKKKAAATLILTRVANPLEFGMVFTDSEGRITRFLEKPSWGEVFTDTINCGIYILEPEVLGLLEIRQNADFSNDLFPLMLEKKMALYGYVADGYWCDVGSPDQYRQAHLDLLEGKVHHHPPGQQVRPGLWVGPGAEIDPGAVVKAPAVVGRNCRIREGAKISPFTVVGDNCIVEDRADMERVILWDNCYIGKNVRAYGSTMCKNVTANGGVTAPEGTVIGDNVFIGQGATLQPDVKIWPDKNVEAGANVSLSLVWGKKWPGSLFSEEGICGLGNIEITPEYALKLGAAYGAILPKGAVVMASRDSHNASRMTIRALVCGLISVGINVKDLQVVPSAISRNAVKNQADAGGGIHCRVKNEDPRSLVIEFYDSHGITIDRNLERKIENRFFREDFRRTPMDEVGQIDFPVRTMDQYTEAFTTHLKVQLIRDAKFRVVLDYSYGTASLALPNILSKLGCEVVSLNAYVDAERSREQLSDPSRALDQLARIVTTLKADLGVHFDPTAERLSVVDNEGRVLGGSSLLLLFVSLMVHQQKEALIAVPIIAPSVIESLTQKHGARVIYTRTDSRTLTYTATLGERRFCMAAGIRGDIVFPGFSPGFDAMYAFARLLELMAIEGKALSSLTCELPEYVLHNYSIECSWRAKGQVMRLLFESVGTGRIELVDGLKVWDGKGWVLVLPDRSEPRLDVWVYAQTEEHHESLRQKYLDLVSGLVKRAAEMPIQAARATSPNPNLNLNQQTPTGVSEDRSFHFWVPGRYLGVRARSLREFVDVLHYIESRSIAYHFERGDFANWLAHELKQVELAGRVRNHKASNKEKETLRNELIEILSPTQVEPQDALASSS